MSESKDRSLAMRDRGSPSQAVPIDAFYEGSGLAAIAVISGAAGIRVAAVNRGDDGVPGPGEAIELRWWCARAAGAAKVANAAMARLQRGESKRRIVNAPAGPASVAASLRSAQTAIEKAAKRYGVTLYPDETIAAAATAIVTRMDQEVERLRQTGELKSVNQAYRTYRAELAARGEKALCYGEWMRRYKENQVRRLAAAWRHG
jgi:hypothetical protein